MFSLQSRAETAALKKAWSARRLKGRESGVLGTVPPRPHSTGWTGPRRPCPQLDSKLPRPGRSSSSLPRWLDFAEVSVSHLLRVDSNAESQAPGGEQFPYRTGSRLGTVLAVFVVLRSSPAARLAGAHQGNPEGPRLAGQPSPLPHLVGNSVWTSRSSGTGELLHVHS